MIGDLQGKPLSDYMFDVWTFSGRRLCRFCNLPVYQESGYWLHAQHGEVDGQNGLYCTSEMWEVEPVAMRLRADPV